MPEAGKMSLDGVVALQGLLGYVNFSAGKPDPRFQKQINDAYAGLVSQGSAEPWNDLPKVLQQSLEALHQAGSAAFREVDQARAVLSLVFEHVLPAYRAHHAILLAHQPDSFLWQPFFLARVFEDVLAQRGPWQETERIVRGTLRQLNDYVGYRPVAVLENRARGEPYEHERVRPIPLYFAVPGSRTAAPRP